MTVATLKEALKERGLPVSGKKAELQERLAEAVAAAHAEPEAEAPVEPEPVEAAPAAAEPAEPEPAAPAEPEPAPPVEERKRKRDEPEEPAVDMGTSALAPQL